MGQRYTFQNSDLIKIKHYHLKIESYVQYKINLNHKSNRFESEGQTKMNEG